MHFALPTSYLGTDLAERYRLERLIGEGATSWVFAARDLRLEREVAVKLLKRQPELEHSAQRVRFVHEGRMLAKLAHPHVVAVYDAGESRDGDGYLVMELSHAGSLEAELQCRGNLELEETLELIVPLLGALACAHDRGVIHRDLKPANIALVRAEGAKTRAKLVDFGIAKFSEHTPGSDGPIGTPAYMAPEQARGEALGPGTDVWAMGIVLFRCLSGGLPFDGSSSTDVLRKVVQRRAARIASACPGLAPRVAIAIDRALEPDPARRYQDMRTFARVLGLACRQDGVRIEAKPEPIGLPDFDSWLEKADLEATKPKEFCSPISEVRTTPALERSVVLPHRARVRSLLLAATAAIVLTIILWSTLGQPTPTRGQPSRQTVSSAARGTRSALTSWLAAEAPPFSSATAVERPAAEPPAAAVKVAVEHEKPASKSASNRVKRIGTSTLKPGPAPAHDAAEQDRQGLITNWEW